MITNLFLHWLDAFYDLPFVVFFFGGIVWMIAVISFAVIKGFSKFWTGVFMFLVGFGVPIALIILKGSLGLGSLRSKSIVYMGKLNNYLVFNDDHTGVSGKRNPQTTHRRRLFMVDLNTGKLVFREPIKGFVNSVELTNDQQILMKSEQEQRYFSVKGNTLTQPPKAKLEDLPELKSGIYKKGYNASTDQVWVINKEGKKYFYNPQTHAQEPERLNKTVSQNKYFKPVKSVSQTEARCGLTFYDPNRHHRRRNHDNGNEIRKPLYVEGNVTKAFFIKGSVDYCLPSQNVGIITSYKTTDQEKLIVTTVNLKTGEIWWQKTCQEMGTSEDKAPLGYIIPVSNHESVWLLGQYILRLESQTGKIIWKTRL